MSILVVGGAGYIGAHIVDLLCDRNKEVLVFDNLSSGYSENLNKNAKFIRGDILNNHDLNNLFDNNKIDSIIHMAALKSVSQSMNNPNRYTSNNIVGSLNLISYAIKNKVKKFIFSSTAAVYGNPQQNIIDENHPLNPINHYGFTKLYVENYLKWVSTIEEIKFVSLRYFNAAGYTNKTELIKFKEKNPENLLPIIMEVANGSRDEFKIFGNDYDTYDGTCIRDYIHVIDLAEAHIKALDFLNNKENLCVNLSSGNGSSVLEVVRAAENLIGSKINFSFDNRREGDPSILIANPKKAYEKLAWKATVSSLEDIISSMWKHYGDK